MFINFLQKKGSGMTSTVAWNYLLFAKGAAILSIQHRPLQLFLQEDVHQGGYLSEER